MIVILGNTNDEQGRLSAIAVSRCKKAIAIWHEDSGQEIITTGTFGGHFNITQTSHSDLLKAYLLQEGVSADKILENINSSNTFQDIVGLREILGKKKPAQVNIVTSDFHYGRVKFYCDLILHDLEKLLPENFYFKIIATPLPDVVTNRAELEAQEQDSMANIMKFPSEVYQNAASEQKHYDTVSNWMITGQLAAFSLGFKYISDKFTNTAYTFDTEKIIAVLGVFFVITVFWALYNRAANNARTARLTLRNIERCYRQFGFSLFYATSGLKDKHFTFKRILEYLYVIISAVLLSQLTIYVSITFLIIYIPIFLKKTNR